MLDDLELDEPPSDEGRIMLDNFSPAKDADEVVALCEIALS